MIADLLNAMGLVLLGWSVMAAALIGLGLLARRVCGLRGGVDAALFDSFWLGIAISIAFLQIWHLFQPVDDAASIVILAAGFIGVAANARGLLDQARRVLENRLFLLLAVPSTIWLANRAIGPCNAPDSGLYHIIGLRWMIEHPIIPGLANLCGPLGFNNSIWLFDAAIDAGPWTGRCAHLATPLLLLVTMLRGLHACVALFREQGASQALRGFQASLLVIVFDSALSYHGSSISTDLPAVLVLFGAMDALSRLLIVPVGPATAIDVRAQRIFLAIVIAGAASAAVTIKVSAVALGGATWLLAVAALWLARRDDRRAGTARPLTGGRSLVLVCGMVVLPTLLLGTWLARGVIQTGYPLFPATVLPFDVDWRVPLEPTIALRDWVIQFARYPNIEPDRILLYGFGWLKPWLLSMPAQGPVKSLFPGLLVVVWGACVLLTRIPREHWLTDRLRGAGRLWLMVPLMIAAGLFWFITAPAPRFGFVMFWTLAGVLLAIWLLERRYEPSRRVLALVLLLQVGSIVPALLIRSWVVDDLRHRGPAALAATLFNKPGSDAGFHPFPEAQLSLFKTDSGFEYWAPVNSDRVWYGPLPSSPYRDPAVRMREPGNLRKGFARDASAPWKPENWPHYPSTFLKLWMEIRDKRLPAPR